MKKIYLLIYLLIPTSFIIAQELPNAGLESWETIGAYEEPLDWNTPNPFTSLLGMVAVSKSDNAAEGQFSARLESILIELGPLQYKVPGLITYANFNVDITSGDFTFGGGVYMPFDVFNLFGKYKYSPAENDSATVLFYSYAHPEGGEIDTIGIGYGFLHAAAEWSDFSFPMIMLNDHTPDSFNVLLMSTATFELDNIPVGSVLYVDDLSIETSVGLFNLPGKKTTLSAYPNPATDFINFNATETNNYRILRIFDLAGKEVKNVAFSGRSIRLNLSGFPEGIYSYVLQQENTLLNSGSFVKN